MKEYLIRIVRLKALTEGYLYFRHKDLKQLSMEPGNKCVEGDVKLKVARLPAEMVSKLGDGTRKVISAAVCEADFKALTGSKSGSRIAPIRLVVK